MQRNDMVETLANKLRTLPPEKLLEVEDFVDFLRIRNEDRHMVAAASRLSEAAFAAVWDNPEDAAYDQL